VFNHREVNCTRAEDWLDADYSGSKEGDHTFQVRVMGEGLAAIALGLREVAHAIRLHADATVSLRGPR
jgi:hypothetical protein